MSIEERIDLKDAIAELTPRQKEALAWRLEGHTQQEIADRLTVSQPAVSCLLFRAKSRVARYILASTSGSSL